MAFLLLYSVTLYLFVVQGAIILHPRNIEDDADEPFQKTEWFNGRVKGRSLCTSEACRSMIRLLGSKRTCLSSCLRVGLLQGAIQSAANRDGPAPGLTDEALADCVHARCFQNGDGIRKELIASCISGPCDADDDKTSKATLLAASDDVTRSDEPEANDEQEVDDKAEAPRTRRPKYSLRSLRKRGYTDATDICIQFHCSNAPRGLLYLKCISDNRCSGR